MVPRVRCGLKLHRHAARVRVLYLAVFGLFCEGSIARPTSSGDVQC